jgi:hypothetical protein
VAAVLEAVAAALAAAEAAELELGAAVAVGVEEPSDWLLLDEVDVLAVGAAIVLAAEGAAVEAELAGLLLPVEL